MKARSLLLSLVAVASCTEAPSHTDAGDEMDVDAGGVEPDAGADELDGGSEEGVVLVIDSNAAALAVSGITTADAVEIYGSVDDLSPLSSLVSIHVGLHIRETTALTTLAGLENVVRVGAADVAGSVTVADNELLTNVDALSALGQTGHLAFEFNPLLESINLPALTTVTESLTIDNNAVLCDVTAPELSATIPLVQVAQNPCLTQETVDSLLALQSD